MAKVRIDNLDENSDIAYLRRLLGGSCDPTEISIHAGEGRRTAPEKLLSCSGRTAPRVTGLINSTMDAKKEETNGEC